MQQASREDMASLTVAFDENVELLRTSGARSAWWPRVSHPLFRRLGRESPGSRVHRPRARAVACAGLLSATAVVIFAAFSLGRKGSTYGNSNSEGVFFAEMKGKLLRNVQKGRCMDWADSIIKTPTCDESSDRQRFEYDVDDLEQVTTLEGKCMDAGGDFVHIWDCAPKDANWHKNQQWAYNPNLEHITTKDGVHCLEVNDDGGAIGKKPCLSDEVKQKWTLQKSPSEQAPTVAPNIPPATKPVTAAPQAPSTSSVPIVSPIPAPTTSATPAPTTAPTTPETTATTIGVETPPATTPPIKEVSEDKQRGMGPMHLRHRGQNELCMDGGGVNLHMWNCNETNDAQTWLPIWLPIRGVNGDGHQLRNGKKPGEPGECLARVDDSVKLEACDSPDLVLKGHPQLWEYNRFTGQLAILNDTTKCLSAPHGAQSGLVELKPCNRTSKNQIWREEGLVKGSEVSDQSGLPEVSLLLLLTIPALLVLIAIVAVLFFCAKGKKRVKGKEDIRKLGLSGAIQPRIPDPKAGLFKFRDPRPDTYPPRDTDVIAFSFPGFEEPWDEFCSASFLGNSYDVGSEPIRIKAKGVTKQFKNAEAAFQALTFWDSADEFTKLSGEAALQQKHDRRGLEDWDYAGFENKWKGMMAVLQSKFKSGSKLERALEKTGDAFLLNHSGKHNEDPVWSDNCDGEGTNWLGMQLMLLRDRSTGWKRWTTFIESSIDRETGERIFPEDVTRNAWQDAVRNARTAVVEEMRAHEEDRASEQPLLNGDTLGMDQDSLG
eukprot:CAMPEP_0172807914 /NCGR_PEP_ID=MMETSP1075-20121228/7331_1 /TAXON_ID=2916 /ORGANISM="Ceratium fusus, Strain PA161109" /LENGTH=771 /DNA_ID=CAMNT_0013646971 /DNA_START=70 /DNA_END=2386 /DNA_ORIENTATION=+